MPRGHRLTPEQRARIRELRAQGQTGEQVARVVGVCAKTVRLYAPGPDPRRVTDEQQRRIRELRAAGLSGARVAAMVGVSARTVYMVAPGYRVRDPKALTPEQIAQIKALRADGHTCAHVAQIVGCSPATVRNYAPGLVGKVPVAPLREAFERSPLTAADVARELGWWCTHNGGAPDADSARVKRALGLLPDVSSRGSRSWRTVTDAETVMRIADVIGVGWWLVVPDEESEVVG